MVYNWDGKEAECYRLYVKEKRNLDEVMEYWERRGFTPSKRVFQTQFKRWGFPSKQNPAHKNPALTSRVKELWEQNSSQKQMLETLHEEGFQINDRELVRVRSRLNLMLRERAKENDGRKENKGRVKKAKKPTEKPVKKRKNHVSGHGIINQLGNAILADTSSESESSEEEQEEEEEGEEAQEQQDEQQQSESLATAETEAVPLTSDEILRRQLRHEQMQLESDEKWRKRKRRRRTRGWAGLPADAPGEPPRFPSETTLDEAKAYLSLDNALYREARDEFQAICEEEGVIKKTVAGPEKWAQVVQRLVRRNPHLSRVCQSEPDILQSNDTMWRPKSYIALSLDVICMDVTKRLRTMDKRMTIPQAKNALGLNPQQARQIRNAFGVKLKENHFTNKYEAGDQRWAELKQEWVRESELLMAAFAQGEADPNYTEKLKAIEALARDVMKRERQEFTQKNPSTKKQAHSGPGPGPAPPTVTPHVSSAQLRNRQNSIQEEGSNTLQTASSGPGVSTSTDMQIDPSLLLAASDAAIIPGTSYGSSDRHQQMHQQPHHPQHHNPAQSNYLSQPQSFYPNMTTGSTSTMQAHMQNTASTSAAPLPIYFRLHPQSITALPSKTLWLSILHTPSVAEIRNLAMREHPGTTVIKVEGLIMYNGGQGQGEREIMVVVEDDQELGAYLGHVGNGKATFVVLLGMAGTAGDYV